MAEAIRRGAPSRPTIYRIQTDPTYVPEGYTIQRLADVLGVSFEWLANGQGPMSLNGVAEESIPYRAEALDAELLRAILETVAQGLESKGVKLPPKVFSTLIVSIYEAALQEKGMREELSSRIQPFIRLALAGAG